MIELDKRLLDKKPQRPKSAKIRLSIPSLSDLIILPKDITIRDAYVDHENWPDRCINFIVGGKGLSDAFIREEAMLVKEALPRMGLYKPFDIQHKQLVAIFGFEELRR